MKKLFIPFIIVILTTSISFAQTFGVKTGISLASVYGTGTNDLDYLTIINPGFIIGGVTQLGEGKFRSTTELLYIQKGFKQMDEDFDYYRAIFNYAHLNSTGNLFVSDRFSLNAGIYLEYIVSLKTVSDVDGYRDRETLEFADDDRRINFGAVYGATYYITENMNLDLRYGLGLMRLEEDFNVWNNSIEVSFGYAF